MKKLLIILFSLSLVAPTYVAARVKRRVIQIHNEVNVLLYYSVSDSAQRNYGLETAGPFQDSKYVISHPKLNETFEVILMYSDLTSRYRKMPLTRDDFNGSCVRLTVNKVSELVRWDTIDVTKGTCL